MGRIVLGRYRICRPLAKGGMGVVYLARQEGAAGFNMPVVVKRMISDLVADESMAKMFKREARLMSRLRHPGIVGVLDFGEEGGDHYMVLEYVHGLHLGQWHRYLRRVRGPFPGDLIAGVMARVLDALHYAHQMKGDDGQPLHIVHRDVSPSNVLVAAEGHVKLADFGIARSRDQTEQTEENTIKGKMPYLAPELFKRGKASPGTDVYACGVVLHELLVGKNEFRGQDIATTVSRVLQHQPTLVDTVRADLPPGLAEVVAQSLEKDPDKRYQTAAEFAKALRAVRAEGEEDFGAVLAKQSGEDFFDARIPEILGVPPLAELDDAWRNPPPTKRPGRPAAPSSSPPTAIAAIEVDVDGPDPSPAAGEGRTRAKGAPAPVEQVTPVAIAAPAAPASTAQSTALVVVSSVAVTVALAAVAAAVWLISTPTGGGEPVFVNVGQTPAPMGPGEPTPPLVPEPGSNDPGMLAPPEEAVPDAGSPVADEPPRLRPVKVVPPRPSGPPSTQELTRAVARQQASFTGCFEQHPAGEDAGNLALHFQIAADGSVETARVTGLPSGSALAQCLVSGARRVRFPGGPVVFQIPLSVRAQ